MLHDSDGKRRRSIRLKEYDYSQAGAYFVTICVRGHEMLLGDVVDGEMQPSRYGRLVMDCWNDLPHHYPHAQLDAFAVMPNHVHGLIVLVDNLTSQPGPSPNDTGAGGPVKVRHPLSEIVRAFKTFSARRINELRGMPGTPVWQRNYYEHVVRGEQSLARIRQYIHDNPQRWHLDRENPSAKGEDRFDG